MGVAMAKTQPVSVRLAPDERQALLDLAASHELSVNQLLTVLVRAAVAPGAPALRPDLKEMVETRTALDSVGRNLNQVARAINMGKLQNLSIDAGLLREAITKTQDVAKAVGRLISSQRERTSHAIGAGKNVS